LLELPFLNTNEDYKCCEFYPGRNELYPRLVRSQRGTYVCRENELIIPVKGTVYTALEKLLRDYPGRVWNLDDAFLGKEMCPLGKFTKQNMRGGVFFLNLSSKTLMEMTCRHNIAAVPTIYHSISNFQKLPGFLYDSSFSSFSVNATREQLYIWEHSDYIIRQKFRNFCSRIEIGAEMSTVLRNLTGNKDDWGVMRFPFSEWILKPKCQKYSHFYSMTTQMFHEWEEMGSHHDVIVVCKDIAIMNDHVLFDRCKTLFKQDDFEINLWLGVAGCGKTTTIVKSHDPKNDLVLACTRTNRDDILKRSREEHGEVDQKSYRTVDSYLMNVDKQFEVVWVDEALMQHAGAILFVAYASRCRVLNVLGDCTQIPYICRMSGYNAKYPNFIGKVKPKMLMPVSHRCPPDACANVAPIYKKVGINIKTTSTVRRSMERKAIVGIRDVPFDADAVFNL